MKVNAQTASFNCGSNGSYGAINVNNSFVKLTIPPDGIFHCTTITIGAGCTLAFSPNEINTPVYLLATGDVIINGTIDVSAEQQQQLGTIGSQGGPGGFQGGKGSDDPDNRVGGAGGGPGGGDGAPSVNPNPGFGFGAGWGTFKEKPQVSYVTSSHGSPYANKLLLPLIGGSGGGGGSYWPNSINHPVIGSGGGGGGGAILIASNARIITQGSGVVKSEGGTGGGARGGNGSSGAIRLVAPVVSGPLALAVYRHGTGRTRVDALDVSGYNPPPNLAPMSVGRNMAVFPSPLPKLTVSAVGSHIIQESQSAPLTLNFPTGSPTAQTVKVKARDFGGIVPIRVRIVPEAGDAGIFDGTIDNTVNNPAETTISVTIPNNTGVRIEVFTR